ncbi:SDR family NAD(P)-dependent oxidoreductase [Cryptosporangium aurantiacum]|uniref:NAD(P)-dependent dehydrogenase, short-chain alcohol dehydrogenase family n=1 Tax=Cryptosporangium aurantiacum TaxID=134849 RepID=A0A1M7RA57_9ACTN|nr:SDR family NAD(P)-dependent oxidoreductase [Cryptosporangium aurantiacum]SHN43225.1 NAD(P)-dependent dehydrogenase, short-chain alcohol dehydrogenase family [Cryptosporangium aurantiacum]
MTDLTGLTAVVTGGNSGIGRAMAVGMAKAGADVAIWARDEKRSAETVAEITGYGVRALAVGCDVTDEDAVAAAMEQTVTELGPLGCLVANAGVTDGAPITEMTLDRWHRVLRTNLDGAFLSTREAARRFVAQDSGGSIVVVSSTVSRYGGTGLAAYSASKTGLLGLGRTLAVELARYRVRCNILLPGWTRTPMTETLQADDRFMAATTARTPVRRWGIPEEFHEVAAFLADPALTFHTGNEVVVDGGYSVF